MKKEITLKDVAEAAGVSKMTASRALRGANDVSQANIAKVKNAAMAIGYVGNHLAASMTKSRSNLIGVVLPSLTNIVFAHVMSGITAALADTSFQPVFGVTDYDEEKEYKVIKNILSWRPAGLIVTGTDFPDFTKLILKQAEIPLVQIIDTDGEIIDSGVGFSHFNAGYSMAQTLIKKGRKKYAYIGCFLDRDYRAEKRYLGFSKALREANLEWQYEYREELVSSVTIGRKLAADALQQRPDLDCIYFSNDDIAAGALFFCMEQGHKVPEDLALVGFNGMDISNSFPGMLATSVTDRFGIGTNAAKLLLESFENKSTHQPTTIELEPIVRLGNL